MVDTPVLGAGAARHGGEICPWQVARRLSLESYASKDEIAGSRDVTKSYIINP
jgi:hypothetical protein